jgi:enamine deaminase RidA (YjgF/YER057c/UK114 family)
MIKRMHTNQRMSQLVIHKGLAYLAGQVCKGATAAEQTKGILDQIDGLLAEAGSSKENMLRATIWLSDMKYFAEFNEVWDAWVPEGHAPARAAGEAKLATPEFLVEILIDAACD